MKKITAYVKGDSRATTLKRTAQMSEKFKKVAAEYALLQGKEKLWLIAVAERDVMYLFILACRKKNEFCSNYQPKEMILNLSHLNYLLDENYLDPVKKGKHNLEEIWELPKNSQKAMEAISIEILQGKMSFNEFIKKLNSIVDDKITIENLMEQIDVQEESLPPEKPSKPSKLENMAAIPPITIDKTTKRPLSLERESILPPSKSERTVAVPPSSMTQDKNNKSITHVSALGKTKGEVNASTVYIDTKNNLRRVPPLPPKKPHTGGVRKS